MDDVKVPVSYLRCAACGKRLDDYGDCDSCTFDREAERMEEGDDDADQPG